MSELELQDSRNWTPKVSFQVGLSREMVSEYPAYQAYVFSQPISLVFSEPVSGKAFSSHGLALKLYFVAAGPKGSQGAQVAELGPAQPQRVEVRHPLDFAMSFLAHLG